MFFSITYLQQTSNSCKKYLKYIFELRIGGSAQSWKIMPQANSF